MFLDFTAAFDVIDHSLLIAKLKAYGFSHSALTWVHSYLSNRTQQVYFNGSLSNCVTTSCGIAQGSCLGPLLFSIFINDFPHVFRKASVVMYADDATLFTAASRLPELNENLQHELNTVVDWVKKNKLVLNISKTKCMIFCNR